MKNYYQILEINRLSSNSEIKSAFRRLAKKFHPDTNKSINATAKFIEIYEAYEILIDNDKRKIYDDLFFAKELEVVVSDNNREREQNSYDSFRKKAQSNAEKFSRKKYKDFFKEVFIDAVATILGVILYTVIRFLIAVIIQILFWGPLILNAFILINEGGYHSTLEPSIPVWIIINIYWSFLVFFYVLVKNNAPIHFKTEQNFKLNI